MQVPVPVNETVCGLPLALSVTEMEPVRDPVAVGVNFTEIVQVPDTATEAPHVLVWLKSPLAAMLVIVSAAEEQPCQSVIGGLQSLLPFG